MLAAAVNLERIRQGKEIQSPLAVEELALARGLVGDAERRVLRSLRKKTMAVSPFEESPFKMEWREHQEEEEQRRWWREAEKACHETDTRCRKREDPGSKGSLRPRLA